MKEVNWKHLKGNKTLEDFEETNELLEQNKIEVKHKLQLKKRLRSDAKHYTR